MDWKENVNLFCNGKFTVKLPDNWHVIKAPLTFRLAIEIEEEQDWDRCQLVARHIEDMTDEEINKAPLEHNLHDQSKKWCIHDLRATSDIDVFLYLLSIGVYPFEWDESVIDKKTITDGV